MRAAILRHGFWAVVLAVVVFYGLGQLDAMASRDVRDWRTAAGLAVKAGKPFRAALDSLKRRENALLATIRTARGRVDTLLREIPRDSIPPSVLLVLAEQTKALDACDLAIATCQQRAAWATARADSLETLLGRGLVVTKCKLLLFPCPSRPLVFLGGAVGGFLLSGAVR